LNNYTNTALESSVDKNNNNLMGTVSNTTGVTANSQNALFPHYNSGPLLGSGPLNSTPLNLAPVTAQSQQLDYLNIPTFGNTTNPTADLSSLNNIDMLTQVLNSMQNKSTTHSNQPLSNTTGYNFLSPTNLNITPKF